MSWDEKSCVATATPSGSSWTSVIIDAPMHPEGSNENATLDLQQLNQDGAAVLASIQAAGWSLRELHAQSRAQVDRLRDLVAQVGERLKAAEARAEEAQAKEQATRHWAAATVEAAEERVRVAEERARVAEMWLARIFDAVRAEFPYAHDEALPTTDRAAA